MTKEFQEQMTATFEGDEPISEIDRAAVILDVLMAKIDMIDEALEKISPEHEPGLVKVHTVLDHMRDLFSIVAGHTAANIEATAEEHEELRQAGLLEEEDEAEDLDLS